MTHPRYHDAMNGLDIALIVLFALGTAMGLARGFVRILIGVLSLLVAFFLASRWQDPIAQVLVARHVAETPARIAAYAAVFVGTMIAGGLVAWLVGKMLKLAMLSWADRLAGGALGLFAAVLAAAFLVYPLVSSSKGGSTMLQTSKLVPYVTVVADLGSALAPDAVAKRYEAGIEALRKVWRGEGPIPVDLEKVKEKIGEAVDGGKKAATTAAEKTEAAVKGATKKK
jgi:membrane protein required for colicin V production